MSGFDWPGLIRHGLRGLGLAPAEFWALTPAEFLVKLGYDGAQSAPLNRARLFEMAARFPDIEKGTGDGDHG